MGIFGKWRNARAATNDDFTFDAPTDATERTSRSAVSVEAHREERPKFRRSYTVSLVERGTLKIDARSTHYGTRYLRGELTQRNGRWVLFDPHAIADKILDPVLVPIIERHVDEILAIDEAFVRSRPATFTDERGDVWSRS
jgi:hypothetical protein